MDRIKTYSGNVTKSSSSTTIYPYYGLAKSSWMDENYTTLFNTKLVEFLTECGVDAKYDGTHLWVNGYPICFWIQTTIYNIGLPFYNLNVSVSASTASIFDSNGNYNFRLRLYGNPKSAFTLLISGNITSLAFNSAGVFKFIKGINIMNGKQGRLFCTSIYSSLYAIDLDEDGTPINAGRASETSSIRSLDSLAVDFANNVNIIPLVDLVVGIHKLSECYRNITNDSFPKPASSYADAQVFLKINNEIYCRDYVLGFIKC